MESRLKDEQGDIVFTEMGALGVYVKKTIE